MDVRPDDPMKVPFRVALGALVVPQPRMVGVMCLAQKARWMLMRAWRGHPHDGVVA